MLFSNILVPYDGSELAIKSLVKAIEFAKSDPAVNITILHVVSIEAKTVHASLYNQFKKAKLDDAKATVEPVKAKLAEIPNASEVLVKEGSSSNVILQQVKELNCDLIIMGSRGLSGIKEFLGSVSHSITQQSPIPVLLMK
jgi:nucleotide-binding universal stress UspA family protein